ncbi:MAG: hypothetical protein V1914_04435 [archaeon]
MATILDIGILEYFTPVFVWLFIFALLYAILDKTGVLGENKGLKALVAFALSMLFVLTQDLMRIVSIMTPWFVILIIAVLFIMIFFLFVGVKGESIAKQFSERITVWIILVLILTIFIYAMTQVYGADIHNIYGEDGGEPEEGLNQAIGQILFHPKMLGIIFILLVAAQAVRLIAQGVDK